MSPELPTYNATSQVPSTKAWLLLMSLLTVLLLAGSRAQTPTRGAMVPTLVGSPAHGANSATAPKERRVALKTPARPPQGATAFAL
jgi:hypothetical protein